MIALVKFVHIAAIAVWAASLISLPSFYRHLSVLRADPRDGGPDDEALVRAEKAVRFTYVTIASPAAFIAIGSGILLIFQQTVIAPWFGMKLLLVAGLVIAHSFAGLTLIRLSKESGNYPVWRYMGASGVSVVIAIGIVTLTLAKPPLGDVLPPALSEPGALKSLVESINPWRRP